METSMKKKIKEKAIWGMCGSAEDTKKGIQKAILTYKRNICNKHPQDRVKHIFKYFGQDQHNFCVPQKIPLFSFN